MEYVPLGHLETDKTYTQTYLVDSAFPARGSNGKPYTVLKVKDVTGVMTVYVWDTNFASFNNRLAAGSWVNIRGTVTTFQNKQSLKTDKLSLVQKPSDITPYILTLASTELDAYHGELNKLAGDISDPDCRSILRAGIKELGLVDIMRTTPFKRSGKLSLPGGLLLHTVRLIKAATGLSASCEDTDHGIDQSVLITGCILRNLGYGSALEDMGGVYQYNEFSRLMGVRYASSTYVRDLCLHTEASIQKSLPDQLKYHLQYIAHLNEKEGKVLEADIICAAEMAVESIEYAAKR